MIFLVDHNLEGHALLLSGNIASFGWLDLLPVNPSQSLLINL